MHFFYDYFNLLHFYWKKCAKLFDIHSRVSHLPTCMKNNLGLSKTSEKCIEVLAAYPIGAMVASVLLYCRFYQSTFYQKSASIECFNFAFCFVHSGNTSSTSTVAQAGMLSISNEKLSLLKADKY